MSTTFKDATATAPKTGNGYRTLWRWHFYAALFVMPFLVVLAITGTLYCFQPQIEPLLYPHRMIVQPEAAPKLSQDALLARAQAAMPANAQATSVRVPDAPGRSAEFVFRVPQQGSQSVYVNPYSGDVLGTLSIDNRLMQVTRMLHRKLLLGKFGELLMELVACWTLVMIGTGIALWWPQGAARMSRAFIPDLTLTGRAFWKSLHASIGIWLAIGAAAFVLSGLPWTGSWGQGLKSLSTRANLGAPEGSYGGLPLRSTVPGQAAQSASAQAQSAGRHHMSEMESMPGMTMDDMPLANVPWAVGAVKVPSLPAGESGARIGIDRVIGMMRREGIDGGYEIALPRSADGVYTVSYFPADPKAERTIYIDQYSGAVMKDIRYDDYGAVSKAVSYGTALHMGRYFGLANQIICAAISLGLASLAVTGFVMWWKRRPAKSVGAPSRERAAPPMRGWKAGMVLLAVIFPLMGATMIAVWLADRAVFRPYARQTS
jgi:uncharacterized iron-regulated membrane protein